MLPDSVRNSGSLVFFAGRSLLSRAIALRTCSWSQLFAGEFISHVGYTIDYRRDELLIESTTLDSTPCFILNKCVKGVQSHPLIDRVNEYPGHVWIARPNVSGLSERYMRQRAAQLRDLGVSHLGMPYDTVGAILSGTIFERKWYHFDPAHFFCSELVVHDLSQAEMSPVRRDEDSIPGLVWPATLAAAAQYGTQFHDLERLK